MVTNWVAVTKRFKDFQITLVRIKGCSAINQVLALWNATFCILADD